MIIPYSYEDIREAFRKVGVSRGKVVLVKTDLRPLGSYEKSQRSEIMNAFFNVLADLVDLGVGTLVVSTASDSLCNTDKPFDIKKTPSERGVLTEFIRQKEGAVRSRHPFMSYTAIGADAGFICGDVSRHSFGLESPKDRMLKRNAVYLSIGLEPRWTCTYVHHVEMLMGVPYRYTKEFSHPIVQENGGIENELFYMFVWYRGVDLERNINVKIFEHYHKSGYPLARAALGTGFVYGYSCADFYNSTADYMKTDIYGWLTRPPKERPYRK